MQINKVKVLDVIQHMFSDNEAAIYSGNISVKVWADKTTLSVYFSTTLIATIRYMKKAEKNQIFFPTHLFDAEKHGLHQTLPAFPRKVYVEFGQADDLRKYKDIFRDIIQNSMNKDIACCSRYVACSDAGHCVNTNPEISTHCYYRTNLEKGIIFYGKNKNI